MSFLIFANLIGKSVTFFLKKLYIYLTVREVMHLFMLITIFSGNHGASFVVVCCDVPFGPDLSIWMFPSLAFSKSSSAPFCRCLLWFLEVELYLCVLVSPRWPPCQCMPAWAVMRLPSETPS